MGPLDLLTAPVLGPIQMVQWLGLKLIEAAEREMYDEGRLRGELLELQARYDLGEVAEEEYARREAALLELMDAVREAKGQGR